MLNLIFFSTDFLIFRRDIHHFRIGGNLSQVATRTADYPSLAAGTPRLSRHRGTTPRADCLLVVSSVHLTCLSAVCVGLPAGHSSFLAVRCRRSVDPAELVRLQGLQHGEGKMYVIRHTFFKYIYFFKSHTGLKKPFDATHRSVNWLQRIVTLFHVRVEDPDRGDVCGAVGGHLPVAPERPVALSDRAQRIT